MIIMWSKNYWPMNLSEFTYIWMWKFFWIWQFYVPKGRYEYFVAMFFNAMTTCNFVLPLSHYHLATSTLMKTRHLVILLSHYLAISYHQALTSRAFWLRVGFGSGLTKKLGFWVSGIVHIVVLKLILWSFCVFPFHARGQSQKVNILLFR